MSFRQTGDLPVHPSTYSYNKLVHRTTLTSLFSLILSSYASGALAGGVSTAEEVSRFNSIESKVMIV